MKPKVNQKRNPAELIACTRNGEEEGEVVARLLSEPEVKAAAIIQAFEGDGLDINYLVAELRTQTTAIQAGNMTRAEAMLAAQAHTLDALFSNLARRSGGHMNAGHGDAAERYMRLALKAQAQALRTIEVLGELKNPKHIAFVAQTNISGGHQQVNNNLPRAGKIQNEQNKLSEGGDYELLPNTRASGYASQVDSQAEAVGRVHRG
jgi:hypothetical protein